MIGGSRGFRCQVANEEYDMLKILIAVDGSEHAHRAIEAVAKMVKSSLDLEVILLCVSPGALLDPIFSGGYTASTIQNCNGNLRHGGRAACSWARWPSRLSISHPCRCCWPNKPARLIRSIGRTPGSESACSAGQSPPHKDEAGGIWYARHAGQVAPSRGQVAGCAIRNECAPSPARHCF